MNEHTITKIRQLLQEAYKGDITSKGWDGMYVLVEKGSGHPVGRGITVTSFRGDKTTLTGGMAPHKPSSTGKVWVEMGTSNVEMGPSAYGLKWEKDLSKHTPKQRPMHKWKSANYDDDDTHRNPW